MTKTIIVIVATFTVDWAIISLWTNRTVCMDGSIGTHKSLYMIYIHIYTVSMHIIVIFGMTKIESQYNNDNMMRMTLFASSISQPQVCVVFQCFTYKQESEYSTVEIKMRKSNATVFFFQDNVMMIVTVLILFFFPFQILNIALYLNFQFLK